MSHRIRGLDALIAGAAERGQLFHEAGAPWASPVRRVAGLEHYRRFDGARPVILAGAAAK